MRLFNDPLLHGVSRRTKFWKSVIHSFPIFHTGLITTAAFLNQFDLVTDTVVVQMSLWLSYLWLIGIILIGTVTTLYRKCDSGFNTWWTENPSIDIMTQEREDTQILVNRGEISLEEF
jgi:hypothetical protein